MYNREKKIVFKKIKNMKKYKNALKLFKTNPKS